MKEMGGKEQTLKTLKNHTQKKNLIKLPRASASMWAGACWVRRLSSLNSEEPDWNLTTRQVVN